MANILKLKRSAVPSKVPTTGDLELGELALNTYDGKLYTKKDNGTASVIEIGAGGGGGTVTSVNASGGTTGLSFSGGPILTSGTLTLSGTLGAANGGTGQSTFAVGDILYSSAANTLAKLAGNTTTTKKVLSQTGNGTASAAPAWDTVTKTDVGLGNVENTALSTWAGSANITTLGTISTGTWNATAIGIAKGGTGLTATPTNGQLPIGNGSGYTLAALTQGTGITITNGGGSISIANASPMTYPGAGIAVSSGSAWSTSLTAPTGTIVGTTDTQTLTNKRVNPRVSSTTSASSLTPNSDNFDQYAYTALAAAISIAADAGTPVDGQKLIFRVVDNGTGRVITFTGGASKAFRPVGVTLTASGSNWTYTTTASKTVYFGCVYNAAAARWDIIAVSEEA